MRSSSLVSLPLLFLLAGCDGGRRPIDPIDEDAGPFDPTPLDGGPLPVEGALAPSDVSVLFPLADRVASPAQLALADEGVGGPLLSRERFDAIPVFRDPPDEWLAYARWRVVAMRVDPCFPDITNLARDPSQCRRQIRLVAQPLADATAGGTVAADSAIHLLFELPPASFDRVVVELRALRGNRPVDRAEVLGVHPTLRSEGLDGAYGRALRALILAHAGHARLAQYTFVRGDENFTWVFGGLRPTGERVEPVAVHGVAPDGASGGVEQTIGFNFGPASIHPTTPIATAIAPLLGRHTGSAPGDSSWTFDGDRDRVRAALAQTLEIEDPRALHAENVDCASCHLAAPLRIRAERLGQSTSGLPRFESAWNLALGGDPAMTGAPNRIRAFGYFHGSPVISQRTVNESAAIADALNAMAIAD